METEGRLSLQGLRISLMHCLANVPLHIMLSLMLTGYLSLTNSAQELVRVTFDPNNEWIGLASSPGPPL